MHEDDMQDSQKDILARIDLLEAQVARLTQAQQDQLTPALRRAIGSEWFSSGEAWRMAEAEAQAAASTGEAEPELAEALRLEGIRTPHGLGRWLAVRPRDEIERGPECRGGVLYRVL